jgi:hypothetical protein
VFAQHIARLFCPLFQKWRPARSRAARLERNGISFLPSFFLCASYGKEKSVTKANYLLILKFLYRFFF